MANLTNAFIAAHVAAIDADTAWARRTRRGDKVVVITGSVADCIRRDYFAAYGDRPVYGPAGVGRAAFDAIVAAVVAADNEQAADYAAFMADEAFAGR